MLSIIVCSRSKFLSETFLRNISETVRTEYELICIDNSASKYSIFSAYNEGVKRSKYPYLCFVHDDVSFHSSGWGEKVIAHLLLDKIGIIGLAGRDLATRIPASWSSTLDAANIIQSYKSGAKKTKTRLRPKYYNQSRRATVLLDGVFLCMKRSLLEEIKFDESFNGFHGYDFDISIQAMVAGYTNYVIYDIKLEHFSKGDTNALYFRNMIIIFKKWSTKLPLYTNTLNHNDISTIKSVENKALWKLIVKLTKRGFTTKEICFDINFFYSLIESHYFLNLQNILPLLIFIIRLLYYPDYFFRTRCAKNNFSL